MTDLKKMMIVNLLGRRFAMSSYMELATPSTGRFYAEVDRDHFAQVSRMMYVTPFMFDDGLPIDFRSPDEDLTGVMQDFRHSGRKVDISLVDGWHTYRTAYRDLVQMFDLLNDGGILVVHDCLPLTREGASPAFHLGEWWGESYRAFLDFVLQNPSLDYVTIDCDHGCGVIIKNRDLGAVLGPDAGSDWLPARPSADLLDRWNVATADADLAYTLFEDHRSALLRLIPADRFMALFPAEAVALAFERVARKMPEVLPEKPVKLALTKSRPPGSRKADTLLRRLQRKLDRMMGRG